MSRSSHVAADDISFIFMVEEYSIPYRWDIFFIHSSVYGNLGCFPILAIINSAAMNGGFPDGSVVKNPLAKQEMWVWSLGRDVPLEKEMATHSSILAKEIP